jgi:two-component system phosphate regulon sensor histidine kinase PhoR
MWPWLTILAVAAAIALHFWWSARFRRGQEAADARVRELEAEHRRAGRQRQTQLELLFNSMVEGVLLLDAHSRVELANPAFISLFGLSGDIRGKTIMEALRLHELAEIVEQLDKGEEVLGRELRLALPQEKWLRINCASMANESGQRQGAILVFHDLTRLKQLESARKEFVANVSHELRTPLSLIKGYCETLLDGAKDQPEVASKFLLTIDRNAERLKVLLEDLLTVSELESGRIKMDLQAVPLRSTVEKVLGDHQAKAANRGIRLENRVRDQVVRADTGRLEQVLGNLVDNAVKYGRESGNVSVEAAEGERGMVEVCVRDDGPGIPPDALERVFERFYRVDKARSREQGGTGLGLSIVKHIIQSHQGRVWAKSELGKGAAFYFTLPAA